MKLFDIFGEISIDDDRAMAQLKNIDDKAESVGSKIGRMAGKIGGLTAKVGGLAIAGGVALFGVATKVSDSLTEIDRMSQKVGMSTEAYQEWDFVMQQFGGSMENSVGDLAMFSERMMDAQKGVGEGAELFGKLGIDVEDTSGKLKSQEQIFGETINKLRDMNDITRRNAIASALLGGTGEDLIPILNEESSAIENMKDKAHELGVVQSEEAVESGVEFSETLKETT